METAKVTGVAVMGVAVAVKKVRSDQIDQVNHSLFFSREKEAEKSACSHKATGIRGFDVKGTGSLVWR